MCLLFASSLLRVPTGSLRAYFRGNGANVVKIAPETALKLTLNDVFKAVLAKDPDHMQPWQRMAAGGLAGAVAQVRFEGNRGELACAWARMWLV